MIHLNLISILFVLFSLLNNVSLLSPAQRMITENATLTDIMQGMENGQGMTNTMTTDANMNGMSGNMSTDMAMSDMAMPADMAMTMKSMNEMMMMCMADMMNSNKKWYWIGGITLAVILLGLLGWWLWRNRARLMPNNSPLLILQRRLAQGEITLEQYEAVKVHLSTEAV